jgi:tRNA A-37 threonylcarbamoyl transferase component Bud32
MHKCNQVGVDTPGVYFVDKEGRRLYIEYIHGEKIKALLWKGISEEGILKIRSLLMYQNLLH